MSAAIPTHCALAGSELYPLSMQARCRNERYHFPTVACNSYKNLSKAQEKFDHTESLWQTITRWNEKSAGWMNDPFTTVNTEELNTEVQAFVKDAFAAHKKASKMQERPQTMVAGANKTVSLGKRSGV